MLFPKVTVDAIKYIQHCLKKEEVQEEYVDKVIGNRAASYFDNMVWLRKLNILSLLHEYIHHAIRTMFHYPDYGNLTLFSDFLDTVFDVIWGVVRYKDWRKHIWDAIEDIKETWNFFKDFVCCIDIEDE